MSRPSRLGDAPSAAVVEAVASAAGVTPRALDPLYDTIDPDALDALVDGTERVRVSFEYEGFTVDVRGNGDVSLDGNAPTTADTDSNVLSD